MLAAEPDIGGWRLSPRSTRLLLVPCLPGPVTLTGAGLIGVHGRGPPESTACRHHARKHGQGGTDGFLRGHARRFAEEFPRLPNAGFGPGPGTVPWFCAARSSFRSPRWPRAGRSAQLRSLPCSCLLTGRLCGRISSIAVRPLAPNRTNVLIPAQASALGRVARGIGNRGAITRTHGA